ncbi:MAG: cytochrome c3 family protein [Acidobacteriales bacterium]|nr:cytochrome c3 family protein [Candidatus Koribacter versatilis]MBI3646589.1 cytochrome c3 family protein [Terriglobales bacterium]
MDTWRNKRLARGAWPFLAALLIAGLARAEQPNSCVECHSALDPPQQVTQEQFAQDIHTQKGLTCASCHGGDPTKSDLDAMSKSAGFRGKPARKDIPALCGKCHSDAAYMRQYNPSLRTDQFAQYQTSVHGKLLAKGDTKVAVCIDCHGVHGLRPASDTRSKVHPTNVAQTCSRCHADPAHMKGYSIPTDQYAGYSASVHHEALAVRGDLSAPTCTTCHGNHGAAPPGVGTVQNVCATCHVFQAQLFEKSPHKAAFQAASLPGCVTCHSNHRIAHPTDALLGTGAQSVCTNCHTSGDAGYEVADQFQQQIAHFETAVSNSDEILNRAESDGMEVSQPRLEQDQARDALTKARVTVHSFNMVRLQADILAGLKITDKTYQDGKAALSERDYRRKGLGISVFFIVVVLIGLRLYIRRIERGQSA